MKVAVSSFAYFVYPFVLDPKAVDAHIRALDAVTQAGEKVWEEEQFPQEDFMPHVARFLNPKPGRGESGATPTARFWKLNSHFENVYGLADRANWSLRTRANHPIAFRMGETGRTQFAFHLALFRSGVGFLTLQARPKSDVIEEWLDFLHYFRFADGHREVSICGERRTGPNEYTPFFPTCPAQGSPQQAGEGVLLDLVNALLQTGELTAGSPPWWEEVFVPGKLLPYVALYVDDAGQNEDCARLLYRLRNFFRAGQEIVPAASDLSLEHPSLLEYAERQWFLFSIEGGAFVACDAPQNEFFRRTLLGHLRGDYFLLFLLALHQRFALTRLSDAVASKWHADDAQPNARETDFNDIRDRLLSFTARGYFAQVMQREHHHRCYIKWLETFQIERLYSEVRDEVQDMHDYILLLQNRRQEEQAKQSNLLTVRLTQLAGFIGFPVLILTLFQALGIKDPRFVLPGTAAALALGGSVLHLLHQNTHRPRLQANPGGNAKSLTAKEAPALQDIARKALPPAHE